MSQRNVEWVIGRLVTDEAFRDVFAVNPDAIVRELAASGVELTPCERNALAAFDVDIAERCAAAIDPRLLKADLRRCND